MNGLSSNSVLNTEYAVNPLKFSQFRLWLVWNIEAAVLTNGVKLKENIKLTCNVLLILGQHINGNSHGV